MGLRERKEEKENNIGEDIEARDNMVCLWIVSSQTHLLKG